MSGGEDIKICLDAWRVSCCFDLLLSFTAFVESHPTVALKGLPSGGGSCPRAMGLVPDWHMTHRASQSEVVLSIFYMDARRDTHFAGVATLAGYDTGRCNRHHLS